MINRSLLGGGLVFGGLLFGGLRLAAQTADMLRVPTRQDTLKGSSTPEKAWWNLVHFDLTVEPDYLRQTITGSNSIEYTVLSTRIRRLQLDLWDSLHIDSARYHGRNLTFQRDGDAWFIDMPEQQVGRTEVVVVYYSGRPKVSNKPPWDGGVVWSRDSLGRPWMAVACQLTGPLVWYPCKNNLGDKPDHGMTIGVIVPDSLVAVANGHLISKTAQGRGRVCYRWRVLDPINNYGTTFYIGKYVHLEDHYAGEKGNLEMDAWVLDYNAGKAGSYLIPEIKRTFPSFEHWLGPYPFYEDGFKMVESPYIGMEHQSAVGYGNHFEPGRYQGKHLGYWDYKTDRMVVHENAHEWFGNSITAKDPADRWLQEGLAGYTEELVMEDRYGRKAAEEFFVARTTGRISNERPVISRYDIFEDGGDDMYLKGWILMHMIRAMMHDDEKFRQLLRGLSSRFYHQSVTSRQIEDYITERSGMRLKPVFDQYLRGVHVPVFEYKVENGGLAYRFSDCVPGFSIPVVTNWTGDSPIVPRTDWQTAAIGNAVMGDSLQISPDLYLRSKKVE